jgi:hypothetical protein
MSVIVASQMEMASAQAFRPLRKRALREQPDFLE